MKKPLHLSVPIAKVDEEQRMVWGYATVEEVDKHGEIIGYDASKKAFGSWIGNIREMHGDKAVGKGVEIRYDDDNKGVWLGAYVSRSTDGENAWTKVKEGILNGFSIGGRINDVAYIAEKDDSKEKTMKVTDYDLTEVSLVDNPACPSAVFQMVKSADGKNLERTEKMSATPGRPVHWWEQMYKFSDSQELIKSDFVIYNEDRMKDNIEKSIWSAQELVSLGGRLAEYIWMCEYDGKKCEDLKGALEQIKAAAASELKTKENWPEAVELAMSTLGIEKSALTNKGVDTMAEETKKSVVGSEDRDANAEVVATAEENGRPVNDTQERADAAGVEVATSKEELVHADGKPGKTQVADAEEGAKADDKSDDAADDKKSTSDAAEDASEEVKDGKKADTAEFTKSTDENDLAKGILAGVEKLIDAKIAPLKEQMEKAAEAPAPSKAHASFVDVKKAEEVKSEMDEKQTELEDLIKQAEKMAANPNEGTINDRIELGQKIRKAQRALDPQSVAQNAAIRATLQK